MDKHTPEPWQSSPKLSGSENHKGYTLYDSDGHFIADFSPRDPDGIGGAANIGRAMECVNGCANIPNPAGIADAVAALTYIRPYVEALAPIYGPVHERITNALRAMGLEP